MNAKTKRHFASWLLLAVFVPMLLLSAVHTHEAAKAFTNDQSECLHDHCGGHIGQMTTSMHTCVLCQFVTLPMLAVAVATHCIFWVPEKRVHPGRLGSVIAPHTGVASLRAPPATSF